MAVEYNFKLRCITGIRSDSDLYTFSFPWKPWTKDRAIAEAPLIKNYLNEAIREQGIDGHIKFHHKVNALDWSSATNTWTLDITVDGKTPGSLRSRFVMLGSGYYDYDEPLKADIPGIDSFEGTVIHPQFWPKDYDYTDKNVVIIGSGATAITLVPNMVDKASHVTMLQRSPSWIVPLRGKSRLDQILMRFLPSVLAYYLVRFKWTFLNWMFVRYCLRSPAGARKALLQQTQAQLPGGMAMTPDFTPTYNPWAQRLCITPGADFYQALRSGKASVKTDTIAAVTEKSIKLTSGHQLHPDVIVTATGLKTVIGGKTAITVDGKRMHIPELYSWKGSMLEGLPNLFYSFGYVDASWTLGSDATAQLAARMIGQLQREGKQALIPRRTDREKATMKDLPFLRLNSTYVKSGLSNLPKAGDSKQWVPRSHYFRDVTNAWWGDIRSSIEWK